MSLGLARDSIGDLTSLVSNAQEGTNSERLLLPSKLQSPTFDTGDEDFLLLGENEEKVEEYHLPSQPPSTSTDHNNVSISSVQRENVSKDNIESRRSSITPKREETQQETPQVASMYSGFSSYNYDHDDYNCYYDPYAPLSAGESDKNFLCCLFPWTTTRNYVDDSDSSSTYSSELDDELEINDKKEVKGYIEKSATNIGPKDEGNYEHKGSSFQTEQNANKQTKKELIPDGMSSKASPPSTTSTNIDDENVAGLPKATILNAKMEGLKKDESNIVGEGKKLKGILKHTKSTFHADRDSSQNGNPGLSLNSSMDNGEGKSRRNLFPTYEPPLPTDEKETKHTSKPSKSVQFSPMARVMPITPRRMMSVMMKSSIWWQRSDYEEFKRAGRIISKAMLEGGSEIWLQTSNAWGNKMNLRKESLSDDSEDEGSNIGEKWWCKFGHSRRGLEHIVTIEEGRTRQQYVNNAIRAVLEEQRRQRITSKDPERLASVAARHTSWARDLALAAGAADEEAVRSNFNTSAKSRVHHLQLSLNTKRPQNDGRLSAKFIISTNSYVTHEILDANTESSYRLRKQNQLNIKKMFPEENERKEDDIRRAAAGFQFE